MNCKMEDINKTIETGVHGLKIGEEGKPYVTFALDVHKWSGEKPPFDRYCLVFSDNYVIIDCNTGEKFFEPIIAYYGKGAFEWGSIDESKVSWWVELPKFKKIL